MKKSYLTLVCILAFALTHGAFAQITSPGLLENVTVDYPGLHDREALVEVEFTVNAQGRPEDLRAVGGFHEPRFVEASFASVNELRFSPATENGSAVPWKGYRVAVRFIVEDLFNTVQPDFSTTISEVEQAIQENDYPEAESLASRLLEEKVRYFFEYAYVNLRLSEIYLLTGRLFEAAIASEKATQIYLLDEHRNYGIESARTSDGYNVSLLIANSTFTSGNDNYTTVSNEIDVNVRMVPLNTVTQPTQILRPRHLRGSVRFSSRGNDLGDKPTTDVLNAMLMEDALQSGIQSYARLGHIQAMKNDYLRYEGVQSRVPEHLTNIIELVDNSLATNSPIQSRHRIDNGDALFFPLRRAFTVAGVEGSLDSLDFQCDQRVVRLAYQPESDWQIPSSWGNCALRFLGEEGTLFSVIEFE